MYNELLEGIFAKNNIQGKREKAEYLQSLQPAAIDLWWSYRPSKTRFGGRRSVRADYSLQEIQESYLLRYFPGYADALDKVLSELRDNGIVPPVSTTAKAVFFGSGPLPELCALTEFLNAHFRKVQALNVTAVDIAGDEWEYARSIVLDHLERPFWKPRALNVENVVGSIADEEGMASLDMAECDIAVVQNCFNELPASQRKAAVSNLMNAFSRMRPGAIGIIVDRQGYPATDEMMKQAYSISKDMACIEPVSDDTEYFQRGLDLDFWLTNMPPLIARNLFYSRGHRGFSFFAEELILAKTMYYQWMAFQVQNP